MRLKEKVDIESLATPLEHFRYDDDIVRKFVLATLLWAGVALLLGVLIAFQLAMPALNMNVEYLTFGRLRPLHTNAAIFAFAGNAIFAGIYYSTQRVLKARLASDRLSRFHFWGWQAIIVAAALTLPLGLTQGKEYAELEWPIDIAIAVVWIAFGVNLLKTVLRRREKHLYVAVWFYIATFVTVALLHVVNSVSLPVSLFKSYSVYSGVTDALVQWWYGHNAVAFFLTTPFLGLMYYFVPKAVNQPVYSYRLSVVHFWTLVFIYIWAGPHHLLNTALPDWAQTLGVAFSVMLWIPSWGGMINGLLTVRGAWDRVRSDPVVKFFVAALTFYGMATFEGPLLSIKSVSAVGHYTDWIVGHVHGGALGWNGLLSFGMIYYLVPRLWGRPIHNLGWANTHFWLASIGVVTYMLSMGLAGIAQGTMWLSTDGAGKLIYPDFVLTVTRIVPLYWVRAVGGALYLSGFILMLVNMYRTIRGSVPVEDTADSHAPLQGADWKEQLVGIRTIRHRLLESMPMLLTGLTIGAVLVGSIIEIVPFLASNQYLDDVYTARPTVQPYTPLQLAGRDIYVREGCYTCHSQMIRKLPAEVIRYGAPSKMEESRWDHPHQWGSKRTGPDLARVGGKYPDLWHYRHMKRPRDIVPGSIMPNYPWLFKNKVDYAKLEGRMRAMKQLGVPYSDDEVRYAEQMARDDAKKIVASLNEQGGVQVTEDHEIVSLIAFLQGLGRQMKDPVKVGRN